MNDRSGMDGLTGQRITGRDHMRCSIHDILFTPLGSRIERRDYGSKLPRLIDQPLNDATLLRLSAATVMALLRWEPDFRPSQVEFSSPQFDGRLTAILSGQDPDGDVEMTLEFSR